MLGPQHVLVILQVPHESDGVEDDAGSKEYLHLFVVEEFLVVSLEGGFGCHVVELPQPDGHLGEE